MKTDVGEWVIDLMEVVAMKHTVDIEQHEAKGLRIAQGAVFIDIRLRNGGTLYSKLKDYNISAPADTYSEKDVEDMCDIYLQSYWKALVEKYLKL